MSIAASFACTVGTQDSLLDLLVAGPEAHAVTVGRGVGHVERVLEILAAVRPCRDRPFATLARLVLEQPGAFSGVICVLLAWDAARRELVDRLRALAVPMLVLLVTDPAEPDGVADVPAAPAVHRLEVGRVGEGLMGLRT